MKWHSREIKLMSFLSVSADTLVHRYSLERDSHDHGDLFRETCLKSLLTMSPTMYPFTIDENLSKSTKIDTHNSLDLQFLLIDY